jgi:hypothetical protein
VKDFSGQMVLRSWIPLGRTVPFVTFRAYRFRGVACFVRPPRKSGETPVERICREVTGRKMALAVRNILLPELKPILRAYPKASNFEWNGSTGTDFFSAGMALASEHVSWRGFPSRRRICLHLG